VSDAWVGRLLPTWDEGTVVSAHRGTDGSYAVASSRRPTRWRTRRWLRISWPARPRLSEPWPRWPCSTSASRRRWWCTSSAGLSRPGPRLRDRLRRGLLRVASSTAARKLLDAGSGRVVLHAVAELDPTPRRLRGTTLVRTCGSGPSSRCARPGPTASSTARCAARASSRCAGSSSPTRRGPAAGGWRLAAVSPHRLRDALGW